MATSNSRDWTLTRTEITTKALQRIGKIGIADTPSANQLTFGAAIQNQLLKSWQAKNIFLWTYSWQVVDITSTSNSECIGTDTLNYTCILSHTAVTGTNRPITGTTWQKFWYQTGSAGSAWGNGNSYTCAGDFNITTGLMGIDRAFVRSPSGGDSQLAFITMEEYWNLSSKVDFGTPTRIAIDMQLTPHIYLYPFPEDDDESIHYLGRYWLQDMDGATDNADLPVSALSALIINVAYEMSHVYHLSHQEKSLLKNDATTSLFEFIQGQTEGPIGMRFYPVL